MMPILIILCSLGALACLGRYLWLRDADRADKNRPRRS